ncbi:single-stranded DNA-binding protein [Candidatus Similichlamydia epinepheli]|uniref:single-stranded DNA-binding protein n=1 Tax=Candidatus Similichlamydia epinepheli TaxID=1903953 RepID=UPI0013001C4F|nr:single-stranded DNA-binding protein [Candidatus Similichlamydia epinepheli]
MNFIEIIGNVVIDPEKRVTAGGAKMTVLVVADNQRKGDKEEVLWWRVIVWDGELERVIPHVRKGSRVVVYGTMRKPRTYVDSNGVSQASLELKAVLIRFIPGSRNEGEPAASSTRPSDVKEIDETEFSGEVEYTGFDSSQPAGFSPGQGKSPMYSQEEVYSEDSSPF